MAEKLSNLSHPSHRSTTEDQAAIANRITSGHYGDKPAIRRVVKEEGRSFAVIKEIFAQLVASGQVRIVGSRYHLASE